MIDNGPPSFFYFKINLFISGNMDISLNIVPLVLQFDTGVYNILPEGSPFELGFILLFSLCCRSKN